MFWILFAVAYLLVLIISGSWGFLGLTILGLIVVYGSMYVFAQWEKKKGGYEARAKAESAIDVGMVGACDIIVYADRIVFNGIQTLPLQRVHRVEIDRSNARVKLVGPYSYGRYGTRPLYVMRIVYTDKDGQDTSARFTSWNRASYSGFLAIAQYVNAHIRYVPVAAPQPKSYEI